ncbi:uncharacterized protein MYCFIDRAFT_86068 [Pseudocercospora fijiensis CIRAD86]|uniref:Uncharacterized protein n=1 Tax=Pseudocercospora fijiensis (strain CIRAD86) TaxID=383855 RepID=N1Q6W1_PSEFD|nr:uncharacterized protein MYCFIDRAFT_86068 [Pseudocercospora fijiensis CIRAD86]EME88295.1 hypothetical protein MYCFIDRAFT_86068 [Pseudocercospora fijiensis CIRAD86]
MPSIPSLFLLALPLVSARIIPHLEALEDHDVVAQWEEVLRALPGDSLKAAVEGHLRPKYREGIFEHGRDAIDAVRSHDPELASKLVDLAKSDAIVKDYLRKRQSDNNTTSATTITTTSPVIVTDSTTSAVSFTTQTTVLTTSTTQVSASPSTQTGVLVPVEITSTAQGGSTLVATTQAFQNTAPTSVVLQITTTNNDGQTVTTSTNAPAAIVTRTDSEGSVVTTASPLSIVAVAPGGSVVASSADMVGHTVVLSRPTPGGVYTTTDNTGEVAIVTYTPGGGTVSELQVRTTTLPDGQRSTITSFAEVGGATDVPSAGSSPSASATGMPGLQSGAGMPSSRFAAEVAIFVGAAIGLAGLVL